MKKFRTKGLELADRKGEKNKAMPRAPSIRCSSIDEALSLSSRARCNILFPSYEPRERLAPKRAKLILLSSTGQVSPLKETKEGSTSTGARPSDSYRFARALKEREIESLSREEEPLIAFAAASFRSIYKQLGTKLSS
ncbi:hypothetical protein BC332_30842 [Capsicum chinense]|nr:hypothetical protein BC332_30842 [Capsicum chinense]